MLPCFFQLLVAACNPWLVTLSIFKGITSFSASNITWFSSLTDSLLHFSGKDPGDYIQPTCIIPDNLPILISRIDHICRVPFAIKCNISQPTQRVLHRFLIGGDDATNCLIYGLERSVWQQSKESGAAGLQSSLQATEITNASARNEKVQMGQWR